MSRAPGPFTPGTVDWGARPSRATGAHYPYNKVLPGKTFDFRILSHAAYEVIVHYDGDRNLPCTDKDGGGCWYPHERGTGKPQVWFQVWNRQAKRVELVALTEYAWNTIKKATDGVADLRGARLELWRQGDSTRCRMGAKLTLNPELCDVYMPPACDMKAQLCKMWNSPLRDPDRQTRSEARFAQDVLPDGQAEASPFTDDDIPN